MWGSAAFNWRGRLLEDWIAERDLCVVNIGSTPTCVRPQGSSVIDITISSPELFSRIVSWKVLEEVTSLSDHCYVYYEIVNHVNNVNSSNNSNNNYIESRNVSRFPSWSWVAFEEKSFCSALAWYTPEALGMLSDDAIDPDTISCKIKQVLADAADFSAKRKRGNRRMKSTYWWNPDIAILRSEVLHTRRKWMRYIRRCNDYWL